MDPARHRGRGLAPPGALLNRPVLLVNPRSGSESPSADELAAAARERGIDVRLLEPDDDVAALAREAAEAGAGALGMAGGDGSLAPVAAAALEHDLPFVPIPFGTRNHFARDAGCDADDPLGALAAFEGREIRVDVGAVAGRVFLNNVSLGLYASFVHDSSSRTKNRLVALGRMLKAAVGPTRRPLDLRFEADGNAEHHRALICLVAVGDYDLRAISDLRGRERLDEGFLYAYVVEATGALRLVTLLARAAVGRVERTEGWARHRAAAFLIQTRRRRIHAALDGEAVVLPPQLDFEVRPRALRVLVPEIEG